MISLSDSATRAGYTVLSHNSPTCCEISGDGDWKRLEKSCHRFVRASHQGHPVDHVTIVMRHSDNTRDLRDVGTGGTRWGKLPSVDYSDKRRAYPGCGYYGPRPAGKKFQCQMTVHGKRLYLGIFPTMEDAARARDKYVIDHDLHVPLNFPLQSSLLA